MREDVPEFAVVDLFAGPGGLAEGFSRVRGRDGEKVFENVMSVEMDPHAHKTLHMRAFFRAFGSNVPDLYYDMMAGQVSEDALLKAFPEENRVASREALNLTLGEPAADAIVRTRLLETRDRFDDRTVLIGGPPCQAYSLIGRARNSGSESYIPADDQRHFLYRKFLDAVTDLRPAVFVMENVKGLLSSSIDGSFIARSIIRDLQGAAGGYTLMPLVSGRASSDGETDPRAFLIRSEEFGIPQKRHRVIIVGVRTALLEGKARLDSADYQLQPTDDRVTVDQALSGLPRLSSRISKRNASDVTVDFIVGKTLIGLKTVCASDEVVLDTIDKLEARRQLVGGTLQGQQENACRYPAGCPQPLSSWLFDSRLRTAANSDPRGHMAEDIVRYVYASVFAEAHGRSPRSKDFPPELAPRHANWKTGAFNDRFRVQVGGSASSTVTSHISKDGHYYIHPDPLQSRSLTVREAARLQTFPDNYLFMGPRTSQYKQVGNAVPPMLAFQIGGSVASILASIFKVKQSQEVIYDQG